MSGNVIPRPLKGYDIPTNQPTDRPKDMRGHLKVTPPISEQLFYKRKGEGSRDELREAVALYKQNNPAEKKYHIVDVLKGAISLLFSFVCFSLDHGPISVFFEF